MRYNVRLSKVKSMFKAIARFSPLLKDARGSSAVEFALVAPVLLLLMLGTVDFGRLLWLTSTVEHAATAGARFAGVRGEGNYDPLTFDQMEATIQNTVHGRATGIATGDLTIGITWLEADSTPPAAGSAAASGGTVTVTATYGFQFFLGGILSLSPFNLTSTSTVTIA